MKDKKDKQKEIRDVECQIIDVNKEFDELMNDFLSRKGIIKRQMARDESKDIKPGEEIVSKHSMRLIEQQEDNLRRRMELFDIKLSLINKLDSLKESLKKDSDIK